MIKPFPVANPNMEAFIPKLWWVVGKHFFLLTLLSYLYSVCIITCAFPSLFSLWWSVCSFLQTLLADIGSLEYRASTYIFAKLQNILIHTYNSLQFSAEMDTSGRKNPNFIPFHTNSDYRDRLSINKDFFFAQFLVKYCTFWHLHQTTSSICMAFLTK